MFLGKNTLLWALISILENCVAVRPGLDTEKTTQKSEKQVIINQDLDNGKLDWETQILFHTLTYGVNTFSASST